MAGELRCKAIRYKTALPLIQGGSATAGPMCAERCPRDYVCEPVVPNFKAHPVVGHKENGESIFRYIYTDIQKELTVKLRQSIVDKKPPLICKNYALIAFVLPTIDF